MTFFYKFGKKARVYYTLSISRGGGPGPRAPPWIRHCINPIIIIIIIISKMPAHRFFGTLITLFNYRVLNCGVV